MSILIKGVNLPRSGVRYLLAVDSDGKVYNWRSEESPSCKAFNVSPHGRLIDADEMFIEFVTEGQRSKRYKIGEKWELNGEEIWGVISRLPTIIEAEVDNG